MNLFMRDKIICILGPILVLVRVNIIVIGGLYLDFLLLWATLLPDSPGGIILFPGLSTKVEYQSMAHVASQLIWQSSPLYNLIRCIVIITLSYLSPKVQTFMRAPNVFKPSRRAC